MYIMLLVLGSLVGARTAGTGLMLSRGVSWTVKFHHDTGLLVTDLCPPFSGLCMMLNHWLYFSMGRPDAAQLSKPPFMLMGSWYPAWLVMIWTALEERAPDLHPTMKVSALSWKTSLTFARKSGLGDMPAAPLNRRGTLMEPGARPAVNSSGVRTSRYLVPLLCIISAASTGTTSFRAVADMLLLARGAAMEGRVSEL